jgi:hypothetical protein
LSFGKSTPAIRATVPPYTTTENNAKYKLKNSKCKIHEQTSPFAICILQFDLMVFYPWRCLWRLFSQITRTMPLRLMTLHLLQIFRTEDRTFIADTLPIFKVFYPCADAPTRKRRRSLLETIGDSSPRQIIGRQLYRDLVSRQNLDEVHPHLAGYVRQDLMAIFHLDPEHGVGEGLQDRPLDFNRVFL